MDGPCAQLAVQGFVQHFASFRSQKRCLIFDPTRRMSIVLITRQAHSKRHRCRPSSLMLRWCPVPRQLGFSVSLMAT